jgi:hypothetical protein
MISFSFLAASIFHYFPSSFIATSQLIWFSFYFPVSLSPILILFLVRLSPFIIFLLLSW